MDRVVEKDYSRSNDYIHHPPSRRVMCHMLCWAETGDPLNTVEQHNSQSSAGD